MRTLHFQVKRRGRGGKVAPAGVHVQYITASRGTSTEYIQRTGPYADRDDVLAIGHGNLPKWADDDPVTFFAAGDKWERNPGIPTGEFGKTRNGRVCTQIDASLPRELSLPDQRRVVQEFIRSQLGNRHAYVWGIHQPTATDGQPYPHVHIAFSERQDTGQEFPPHVYFSRVGNLKDRRFNDAGWPAAARQAWSDTLNVALEECGSISRVDPRSLLAQGIDREPVQKLHSARLQIDNSELRERPRYEENHAATHRYWEARKVALGITPDMSHDARMQRIAEASRQVRVREPLESLETYKRRVDQLAEKLTKITQARQAEEHYVAHPEQLRTPQHNVFVNEVMQGDNAQPGQVRKRSRKREDDERQKGRSYGREW